MELYHAIIILGLGDLIHLLIKLSILEIGRRRMRKNA